MNTHTRGRIYSRQIRREVEFARPAGANPTRAADAVVLKATQPYFERVAGRRQEFRRRR